MADRHHPRSKDIAEARGASSESDDASSYHSIDDEESLAADLGTTITLEDRQLGEDGKFAFRYRDQSKLIMANFGASWHYNYAYCCKPEERDPTLGYEQMIKFCNQKIYGANAAPTELDPDREVFGKCLPLEPDILPIVTDGYMQCFGDGPSLFYFLPEQLVPSLKGIEVTLESCYQGEDVEEFPAIDWKPGMACAAHFAEDGKVYRALVVEEHENEEGESSEERSFLVHFVDWGNYELVPESEMMPLYQHLAQLPPVAYPCTACHCPGMLTGELTGKELADWKRVIEQCDFMIRCNFQNLITPFFVELWMDARAPTPLACCPNLPLWNVMPLEEAEITDDAMKQAKDRIARTYDTKRLFYREGKQDEQDRERLRIGDGLEDFEPELFGTENLTDAEFEVLARAEHDFQVEMAKENRKRQRNGPSRKFMVSMMNHTRLKGEGRGGEEPKNWDWVPLQGRTWFSPHQPEFRLLYDKPKMVTRMFTREPHAFVSYIGDASHVYLKLSWHMEHVKRILEELQRLYNDDTLPLCHKEELVDPGNACVARDPHNFNRFSRCKILSMNEGRWLRLESVDFGWTFSVSWKDIESIKPLFNKIVLNDRPQVYHCKIKTLCERPFDQEAKRPTKQCPTDTAILKEILPVGTPVDIFFDDTSKKVTPWRVQLYIRQGGPYRFREVKEVYSTLVESRTGVAPQFEYRPDPPPSTGFERKLLAKQRVWAAEIARRVAVSDNLYQVVSGRLTEEECIYAESSDRSVEHYPAVLITCVGTHGIWASNERMHKQKIHVTEQLVSVYETNNKPYKTWRPRDLRVGADGALRVRRTVDQGQYRWYRVRIAELWPAEPTPTHCRLLFFDTGEIDSELRSLNDISLVALTPELKVTPQCCFKMVLDGLESKMSFYDNLTKEVLTFWLSPGTDSGQFYAKLEPQESTVNNAMTVYRGVLFRDDENGSLNNWILRTLDEWLRNGRAAAMEFGTKNFF